MDNQFWSWLLAVVGATGFLLAGRKVWWAWYLNIANQALWLMYALATQQWGFIAAALFYTVIFVQNAVAWTKEHFKEDRMLSRSRSLDTNAFGVPREDWEAYYRSVPYGDRVVPFELWEGNESKLLGHKHPKRYCGQCMISHAPSNCPQKTNLSKEVSDGRPVARRCNDRDELPIDRAGPRVD